MKGTKHFTETIKAYLDERAKSDELFAERRKATNRSIDDITTYILNQVKASGCNGFSDDEIFGMAVHAAEELTLDIGKPVSCSVIVNHQVVLTEEEKAEARQEALRTYQAEQLRKLQQRQSKPKPTSAEQQNSPSLFDFSEE